MGNKITSSAPGRVNLIGEHTDYNDGFVLPLAIPQRTTVELEVTRTKMVRISSDNIAGAAGSFEYALGEEQPRRAWTDYLQGVTKILAHDGYEIGGFEARISSEVPMGGGLSSSAALEVALLRALREAFKLSLTDVEVARLGQRVENEFVGARVGIMDQMASSLASDDRALFIDTRDLSFKHVALPRDAELMVINSGISHSNASGQYNIRRSQCEEACSQLGIKALRDAQLNMVEGLPDGVIKRRARHVVTENARVLKMIEAIGKSDLAKAGELLSHSHRSMRDDYEVSAPEIDFLVELAQAKSEIWGARLTGGGFGGSIVALARRDSARRAAHAIAEEYAKHVPYKPNVLVPEGGTGRCN